MIITVMDTETTGVKHSSHEIIEIALISYVISEAGERFVMKSFSTKVKPRHIERASPKALQMNHYSEAEWASAPDIANVLPIVNEMIKKSDVMIGQNLILILSSSLMLLRRMVIKFQSIQPILIPKQWLMS